MLFSYSWLQEYNKSKLPKPDKLADFLNMHAFQVEDIKQVKGDTVLDVAVLPNRAHDCLNHIGIAREIATILKSKFLLPKVKQLKKAKGNLRPIKVHIESAVLVPRYSAVVIEGIQVKNSPAWLRDRLEAVGVNSINNIVDLTNYIMLETGQPLHVFDYDQIEGQVMRIRAAKEGEKVETLDDQTLVLPRGTLIIEDKDRLIDLAGIKGGKASGVSAQTKNIVLQAANFDRNAIYKARKKLRYTTQAADIYSHGIDPNLTVNALERANELMSAIGAKGKIVQVIDFYPKKVIPRHIKLESEYISSLLGLEIPIKESVRILEMLGCKVKLGRNILDVEVPTRRIDLAIPEDLIEEIGRIFGFEKIPTSYPFASLLPRERNQDIFWQEMIRDIFKTAGFTEVYNYSFIGDNDVTQFAFNQTEQEQLVELENPIGEEFKYLRSTLLEHLLKNVFDNQKKVDHIRIFEIGKIFRKDSNKINETKMLGGLLGGIGPVGSEDAGFYEVKGLIDFLCDGLGIHDVWYDDYNQTPDKTRMSLWHKGKSAEVKVNGQEIGFVGEISAQITSNLKIVHKVTAFHIDLEKLIQLASEEKEYRPTSRFPSSTRDISVLVPKHIKVVDVMNRINAKGKSLVRDIDLFDMYEGQGIPDGKKSLAFHIVYQADDRTLTSKEIDSMHDNIMKVVEENLQWEVRK